MMMLNLISIFDQVSFTMAISIKLIIPCLLFPAPHSSLAKGD
jgi:hypothetical protein